jgi:dynein heavy chain, axonemal
MENFIEANRNLDLVTKGLQEYLEKKRSSFARFYFLSDGELLEILSQTKEVRRVRSHLRKVFEAIADLEFKQDDSMVAMISAESEKIDFVKRVSPTDRNVEFWMGDVEKQMVASTRHVFELGLKDYAERERNEWVISHPGQIVLNASQVVWTKEVEDAIFAGGVESIKEFYQGQLKQLESTVMLVRQKLTKLAKISVNALIVIDVHARTVVEELIDA